MGTGRTNRFQNSSRAIELTTSVSNAHSYAHACNLAVEGPSRKHLRRYAAPLNFGAAHISRRKKPPISQGVSDRLSLSLPLPSSRQRAIDSPKTVTEDVRKGKRRKTSLASRVSHPHFSPSEKRTPAGKCHSKSQGDVRSDNSASSSSSSRALLGAFA